MTAPLLTQPAAPRQVSPPTLPGVIVKQDVPQKVGTGDEEPYTMKCICNFTDDDGATIYCETCDTWQHIDCFYPNNRAEAIREDFAHSCADCKPRPLDREKAIERTLRFKKDKATVEEASSDKKPKRPPPKSHKKRSKPIDAPVNGHDETGKHGASIDHTHPPKKSKSAHRSSQSISSLSAKRSPSSGNARPNPAQPPSPALTPPDLPDDFRIHHYSPAFTICTDLETLAKFAIIRSLALPSLQLYLVGFVNRIQ